MSVPQAKRITGITYAAAKAHVDRLIVLKILDGQKPFSLKGVKYHLARELMAAVEGPLPE